MSIDSRESRFILSFCFESAFFFDKMSIFKVGDESKISSTARMGPESIINYLRSPT
ncbi:MAG: hypothetical protein ACI9XO_000497 [Paraglaciecola sp.]|jgi:hypothetical protein